MKLKKSLRIAGKVIPAGTTLQFSNEGYTVFNGVRINKNMIPEVAIESAPSQRRGNVQTAVLKKAIRFKGQVIPAGESLQFDAEGNATYAGETLSIYQIPSVAFTGGEAATESLSPVKLKMPVCVDGTVIPANETLMFNANGFANFNGQQISIYDFPTAAIESEGLHDNANNVVMTEGEFKKFEDVQPGDMGQDENGEVIRFLGKAVGKKGYDALIGQFGNASNNDFDTLTAGMDQETIDAAQFVSYTISDGTVCIGLYGVDYAIANESDDNQFVKICDVQSGDAAVDSDGKPCTIVAKGQGTVWYSKMIDALGIDCRMKEIKERLGLDDDDNSLQDADFVITIDKAGKKCIDIYGANGVKVFNKED